MYTVHSETNLAQGPSCAGACVARQALSWARAGTVVAHLDHSWALNAIIRWIRSDSQARLSLEPNCDSLQANPSAPLLTLPHFSSLCRTKQNTGCRLASTAKPERSGAASQGKKGFGTVASPHTGTRAHRWVDAPPSSGFSVWPFVTLPLLQR
jgi:hypothetical protein